MELPRPVAAGIVGVVVLLIGAVGYFVFHSDSSTASTRDDQQIQQATTESYKATYHGQQPDIYTNPNRARSAAGTSTSGTSTSGGGSGGADIYNRQ